MEEEFDRASALAHDLGDLLDLLVLTELEHHRRPLVAGQLIDRRPDAAATIAAHDLVVDVRRAAGQTSSFLELHLAVLTAVMVGDRVQRDLVEPGGEGMAGVGIPLDTSKRLQNPASGHPTGRPLEIEREAAPLGYVWRQFTSNSPLDQKSPAVR